MVIPVGIYFHIGTFVVFLIVFLVLAIMLRFRLYIFRSNYSQENNTTSRSTVNPVEREMVQGLQLRASDHQHAPDESYPRAEPFDGALVAASRYYGHQQRRVGGGHDGNYVSNGGNHAPAEGTVRPAADPHIEVYGEAQYTSIVMNNEDDNSQGSRK